MLTVWNSGLVAGLSDRAKLLWWTLISCPGRLACGVVVKPVLELAEKLKWKEEAVNKASGELEAKGLAFFGQGCVWLPPVLVEKPKLSDPAFRKRVFVSLGKVPDRTIRRLIREAFSPETEEERDLADKAEEEGNLRGRLARIVFGSLNLKRSPFPPSPLLSPLRIPQSSPVTPYPKKNTEDFSFSFYSASKEESDQSKSYVQRSGSVADSSKDVLGSKSKLGSRDFASSRRSIKLCSSLEHPIRGGGGGEGGAAAAPQGTNNKEHPINVASSRTSLEHPNVLKTRSAPPVPPELEDLELYRTDENLLRRWPELYPAWKRAYPELDVLDQIRKAHAWELGNPKRRKKDRPRYLTNWLNRAAVEVRKNGKKNELTVERMKELWPWSFDGFYTEENWKLAKIHGCESREEWFEYCLENGLEFSDWPPEELWIPETRDQFAWEKTQVREALERKKNGKCRK